MGRSKKKFIAKGEGQHFYVLHRSQRDEAYAGEEEPSNFVLVKAGENGNSRKQMKNASSTEPQDIFESNRKKNHVDSLGFRNDGYDYSQHLKEMGGGKYIGVDGKMQNLPTAKIIELPDDVLPSEFELERNLEAITIGHEFMDDDIKDVLFGLTDDFEELDDNFISDAMIAPEKPDFDFDAHIAKLIAKSEGALMGQYDDEDEDDEGEYEDYNEDDEDDDEGYGEGEHRGRRGPTTDEMKVLESQFNLTLQEYEDDAIGGLDEEADDEELAGEIDVNDDNELLEDALDEFLEEAKDGKLAEGVQYTKGSRVIGDATVLSPEELAAHVADFTITSTTALPTVNNDEEATLYEDELFATTEYLRHEKVQEKWDCETILSTYSTLDNHPSMLQVEARHGRKVNKGATVAKNSLTGAQKLPPSGPAKQIQLTGKLMFPKGFGPSDGNGQQALQPIQESAVGDNNDRHAKEDNNAGALPRRKGESAEEKKLRKTKAKEDKREKRQQKKETKVAYKMESVRQNMVSGNSQDIDGVSVFKYTG